MRIKMDDARTGRLKNMAINSTSQFNGPGHPDENFPSVCISPSSSNLLSPSFLNVHKVPDLDSGSKYANILNHDELLDVNNSDIMSPNALDKYIPPGCDTELIQDDLTEEDRRLAATLVAVQFQQKNHSSNIMHFLSQPMTANSSKLAAMGESGLLGLPPLTGPNKSASTSMLPPLTPYNACIPTHLIMANALHQLPPLKKGTIRNRFLDSDDLASMASANIPLESLGIQTEVAGMDMDPEDLKDDGNLEFILPDDKFSFDSEESDTLDSVYNPSRRQSLPHKKRIPRRLRFPKKPSYSRVLRNALRRPGGLSPLQNFVCELCLISLPNQWKFFEHLKSHYDATGIPYQLEPSPLTLKKGDFIDDKLVKNGVILDGNKTSVVATRSTVSIINMGTQELTTSRAATLPSSKSTNPILMVPELRPSAIQISKMPKLPSPQDNLPSAPRLIRGKSEAVIKFIENNIPNDLPPPPPPPTPSFENLELLPSSPVVLHQCEICKRAFRRIKAYETHMANSHVRPDAIEEFSEPEDMMAGIRVNVNSDEEDSLPPDRKQRSGKLLALKKCMETSIPGCLPPPDPSFELLPLPSEICKKSFRRLKSYEAHLANIHVRPDTINEFSEPEDMMAGIRVNVDIEEEDPLPLVRKHRLGKSVAVKKFMVNHIPDCLPPPTPPFPNIELLPPSPLVHLQCEICKRSFRRLKAYEAHMANSHVRPDAIEEFSEPEDMMAGIRVNVNSDEEDSLPLDRIPTEQKNWYPENDIYSSDDDFGDIKPGEEEHGLQNDIVTASGVRAGASNVRVAVSNVRATIPNDSIPVSDARSIILNPVPSVAAFTNNSNSVSKFCGICKRSFKSREECSQHIGDKHGDVIRSMTQIFNKPGKVKSKKNPLICLECGKKFVHRNSYKYHIRSHLGKRPYNCNECGKNFFAKSVLKVHLRRHTGARPFKCEFCARLFRQWGDLKYHVISIHTNQKNFQCEVCGKDFARKYSLTLHMRIHTGERNYKCEFCDKKFRASSYLLNHRKIHTGEKPHKCDICDRNFRVKSDMNRHRLTHKTPECFKRILALKNTESSDKGDKKLGNLIEQQINLTDICKAEGFEPSTVSGILTIDGVRTGKRQQESSGSATSSTGIATEPKSQTGVYFWQVLPTA